MLRVSQPVAIELTLAEFAADRDFAAVRESRSRGGASLADLLKRMLAGSLRRISRPGRASLGITQGRWRITYLYGDGRCDLALREAAGERTLRNFPLRYLRALPTLVQTPASEDMEAPSDDPEALSEFIKKYKK